MAFGYSRQERVFAGWRLRLIRPSRGIYTADPVSIIVTGQMAELVVGVQHKFFDSPGDAIFQI